MTTFPRLVLLLVTRPDFLMVWKATIVLALGLAALSLTRRARAAVQHLLMTATFIAVLLLPFVVGTMPSLLIHVPVPASTETLVAPVVPSSAIIASESGILHEPLYSLQAVLRLAWAAGAIGVLLILAVDLRRLRLLRQQGIPWREQFAMIQSLARANGIHRSIDVLLHEGATTPLTYGIWRPAIILPIDASDWSAAELGRALVHELEHVRRHDWITQLLARFVCACYWFNPLIWTAWRQLCLAAERTCDDSVLQSAESTEYADQLVNLARRISTTRAVPSLAMASRSDLSSRVTALLDARRRRGRAGYPISAAILTVSCAIVLVIASVKAIAAPATPRHELRAVPHLQVSDDTALQKPSTRLGDALLAAPPSIAPKTNRRSRRRVHHTIDAQVTQSTLDSSPPIGVTVLEGIDSSTKHSVKRKLSATAAASSSATASQSSSASSSANKHRP